MAPKRPHDDIQSEIDAKKLKTSLDLISTIRNGNIAEVRNIVKMEGNVDFTDFLQQRTPLFHAAYYQKMEIVQELLEHGADVNYNGGITGETAISAAIQNGDINMVKTLLKHGANPKVTDYISRPLFGGADAHHEGSRRVNIDRGCVT